MLVLDRRRRLYFSKKSYTIFAAAPVATTSLGLGICTCPRPKEVVDWYTNGEQILSDTLSTHSRAHPFYHTAAKASAPSLSELRAINGFGRVNMWAEYPTKSAHEPPDRGLGFPWVRVTL